MSYLSYKLYVLIEEFFFFFFMCNPSTSVKSNLQVFRAKFSEITPNSIRRACETLMEPDCNISDAVDVRQELDLRIGTELIWFRVASSQAVWFTPWLFLLTPSCLRSSPLGASFTRFQTLRLQKIFPESLANQLISYGSCQFPTLGFVVERFKAIQAFIPETFYKIKGTYTHPAGAEVCLALPTPHSLCLCFFVFFSQCCTRWTRTPWSSAGRETVSSTTRLAWCSIRSAWR